MDNSPIIKDMDLAEQAAEDRMFEAAKELIRRQGLEQTTVLQITQLSKVSRQTFYRHFIDKYDLVNQICYRDFISKEADFLAAGGWSAIKAMLTFFESDRLFYGVALQDTEKNAFGTYFNELFCQIIIDSLSKGFRDFGISETSIERLAMELADDFRITTFTWLLGEEQAPASSLIATIENASFAFAGMLCASIRTTGADPPCQVAPDPLYSSSKEENLEHLITRLQKV